MTCSGTTDDSAALQAGLAQFIDTGAKVIVPNGCRLLMAGNGQIRMQGFSLVGGYGRDNAKMNPNGYGDHERGRSCSRTRPKVRFSLDRSGRSAISSSSGRNQTEVAMHSNNHNPIVYPAMMVPYAANGGDNYWSFDNNQVVNA